MHSLLLGILLKSGILKGKRHLSSAALLVVSLQLVDAVITIRMGSEVTLLNGISSSHGGEYEVQICLLGSDDGGSTYL
jgi:hypothetical protein